MSRLVTVISTFVACAALAACGGTKPTAPTTTPGPTAVALVLSRTSGPVQLGSTFQITATLTLSNGEKVTSGFTWTTSDQTVATVSAAGLVTTKAEGTAVISVSASGLTASVALQVSGPRAPSLEGYVAVSAGTAVVSSVADARVTVADGPYAGVSATTSAAGHFELFEVSGVLHLQISAPGFETSQFTATAGSGLVVIPLTRSDHPVVDSALWSVPYGDARSVHQAELTFSMQSAGRVDLSASAQLAAGESAPLCIELRDDDNRMLWTERTFWQGGASTTRTLEGGRRYALKINDCFVETSRPTMFSYRLFAVHPS